MCTVPRVMDISEHFSSKLFPNRHNSRRMQLLPHPLRLLALYSESSARARIHRRLRISRCFFPLWYKYCYSRVVGVSRGAHSISPCILVETSRGTVGGGCQEQGCQKSPSSSSGEERSTMKASYTHWRSSRCIR